MAFVGYVEKNHQRAFLILLGKQGVRRCHCTASFIAYKINGKMAFLFFDDDYVCISNKRDVMRYQTPIPPKWRRRRSSRSLTLVDRL
jgi:hypothetical protein